MPQQRISRNHFSIHKGIDLSLHKGIDTRHAVLLAIRTPQVSTPNMAPILICFKASENSRPINTMIISFMNERYSTWDALPITDQSVLRSVGQISLVNCSLSIKRTCVGDLSSSQLGYCEAGFEGGFQ